jgi:hypothetical protein
VAFISFVFPKETNQRKRHPTLSLFSKKNTFGGAGKNSLRSDTYPLLSAKAIIFEGDKNGGINLS